MYKLPEFFLTLKEVITSSNIPKSLQQELFGECLKWYGYRYLNHTDFNLLTDYKRYKPDLEGFNELYEKIFNVFKEYCFFMR